MTGELCRLRSGDLITIMWSGQPRTVVVEMQGAIDEVDVSLRDLTKGEEAELLEVADEERR